MNSEDFYHECLGHYLVGLYDPEQEPIPNFQTLLENKEMIPDNNNNNGQGVARILNYSNRQELKTLLKMLLSISI